MPLSADSDPHALLTTALEKLLYLESRLESAEAAREDLARESERQRVSAKESRRALVEWQRRARDAEVQAEGAEREVSLLREAVDARPTPSTPSEIQLAERLAEAEARLDRFSRERETWLDRMVSLSRLRTDADDGGLDLGSFIAELRGELMALRRGEDRVRATVADGPHAPDAAALVESAPEPEVDVEALVSRARVTRPERTLARLCAHDLASDSASVRRRAAERLAEAKVAVLNPFVQSKLKSEPDAHARIAYLKLLASTGGDSASLTLAQALGDDDVLVRAEVVEALARRQSASIAAALADRSPAVRRRAVARLSRSDASLDALADALGDDDESVRRVAALQLASRPGLEAEAMLQQAAHSADESTRTLAREALARRGVEVRELEAEPDGRSPFESAREEPLAPLRVSGFDEGDRPISSASGFGESDRDPEDVAASDDLATRIVEEIRTALRGRTTDELATRLSEPFDVVSACAEALVLSGALVWRGVKLYLP